MISIFQGRVSSMFIQDIHMEMFTYSACIYNNIYAGNLSVGNLAWFCSSSRNTYVGAFHSLYFVSVVVSKYVYYRGNISTVKLFVVSY